MEGQQKPASQSSHSLHLGSEEQTAELSGLSSSSSSRRDLFPPHAVEARLIELLLTARGRRAKKRPSLQVDEYAVPPLEKIKILVNEFPKVLGRIPKNTPTYLLSKLDNEKLSPLNHAFVQEINGIDKHLFIEIVESAIEVESGDRLDIVFGLDELFEEIDINGDGKMEWSEFTQYIIDAVEDVNENQPGNHRS